jgi:hypothetical protein
MHFARTYWFFGCLRREYSSFTLNKKFRHLSVAPVKNHERRR